MGAAATGAPAPEALAAGAAVACDAAAGAAAAEGTGKATVAAVGETAAETVGDGILIVAAAVGLGGKLMRTVSFLG